MSRRVFHRLAFVWLIGGLLYGGLSAHATDVPATRSAAAAESEKAPHIALLLPRDWQTFAPAAEAVRAGFLYGSKKEATPGLPIRLYSVTEEARNVIAVYRQAVEAGAQVVVGPLTRNGVSALASAGNLITVTTLALNVPEHGASAPKLYTLSLQLEAEAREVAQLALRAGKRKAFTVSEPTPLSRRVRDAFVEEFEKGGGNHIAEYTYTTDTEALDRMKRAAELGVADMVFFAVDGSRVANVRTYMDSIAAYGTSQVNPGTGSAGALSNVRFVDMPWMVQPDNPMVVLYSNPGVRESDDLERLYALGVDAFRVAEKLLDGNENSPLDGVTGKLTLGADHQFHRSLLLTLIEGGKLIVLGEADR